MKTQFRLVITLAVTMLLTACGNNSITLIEGEDAFPKVGSVFKLDGKPFTGKVTGYWENGQLKYKGELLYGEPDGVVTEYYQNGNLKSTSTYSQGIKNGDFWKWEENGCLSSYVYRKNGVLDSCEISFYGDLPTCDTVPRMIWLSKDGVTYLEVLFDVYGNEIYREYNPDGINVGPYDNIGDVDESDYRYGYSSGTHRYNNSYNNTGYESNDVYTSSDNSPTPCSSCNKNFRFKIYKYGWQYVEESKPGWVKCGGCTSYGYNEDLDFATNTTTQKTCHVSSCINGWVKCNSCYGKGTR